MGAKIESPQTISRDQARARGLRHYYTGKQCKYGHLSQYWTSAGMCVECGKGRAEYQRAWRQKNPEKYAAHQSKQKRRRLTAVEWASVIIPPIRCRAKEIGVPFDLSPSDIIIPDVCPALGIPIQFGGGKSSPNRPSVDRINPQRGYVSGNCRIISARANTLKRDCINADDLQAVADDVRSLRTRYPHLFEG